MLTQTKRTPFSRRTTPAKPRAKSVHPQAAGDRTNATVTPTPVRAVFGQTEPSKKEIRDRAYYIYLARGGVNGDHVSDWIRAERELCEELRSAASLGRRF